MKKKTKKKRPLKSLDPFEIGLNAEQELADSLCKQLLKDDDEDAIDDAFIGAFKGLSYRMLAIFKKEFVFELLNDMVQLEADNPHVCDVCEGDLDGIVSEEDRKKMN